METLTPSLLREFREALGLGQSEMADRLGIERTNYNAMEVGRRVMGSGFRARLALVLIECEVGETQTEKGKRILQLCADGLGRKNSSKKGE